jgi:hypothetical protein
MLSGFAFPLLAHMLPQKKRLSIATSLSDRSDTESVDGSPLHHGGNAATPPLPSSATPPSTICRTSSQHDSSERDRSSTPLSNGSAEDRVIVVKVYLPNQSHVICAFLCFMLLYMLECSLVSSQTVAIQWMRFIVLTAFLTYKWVMFQIPICQCAHMFYCGIINMLCTPIYALWFT